MKSNKYYEMQKRIDIAKVAVSDGMEKALTLCNVKKPTIQRWITLIGKNESDLLLYGEAARKYSREYYKNLPPEKKQKWNKYRAKNQKKFYEKHPFKRMVKNIKKGVRNRGLKSDSVQVTPLQLWRLLKKQKMRCAISGIKLNKKTISIDHIIPIAKGGSSDVNNLQFVHVYVNTIKLDKTLPELIEFCKLIVDFNKTKSPPRLLAERA